MRPILSALVRNRTGAMLIAMQIGITLAIVCNALFVIYQRVALISRPTGMTEENLLVFDNKWIGTPADEDARFIADLATIRALPDVVDAYGANTFPLRGGGFTIDVGLTQDQASETTTAMTLYGDDHALPTLGVRLVEGRNFTADEVGTTGDEDRLVPAVVIISKALAAKMFQQESAVGRTLFLDNRPTTVVGVLDRLQTPFAARSWARNFSEETIIEPYRLRSLFYSLLIRVKPGTLESVAAAARSVLTARDRNRVIDAGRPFAEVRAKAYRDDRGLAKILAVVCTALLGITALGIVGLTSFWVMQRRRQIGVRRALGATRRAIVAYFQIENLFIALAGAALGAVLAIGMNVLMVRNFDMAALPLPAILIGVAMVLALGQIAVLWPAMRAASIPPALATRGG